MQIAEGTVFGGDFRIERALATGGMGSVWVAEQISTGKKRALKVMRADLVADPKQRERFVQEAKVGARIASDHVVEVIAAGVDDKTGMPWLVMELLEGEDLATYVARRGALPVADVTALVGQIAHALAAAHAVHVVHRDLKPENVFIAEARREGVSEQVKLLDFGIAKVMAGARATATAPIGTVAWMAPEQAESDGEIGPATDIWSFGLLVFFLLTGETYWPDVTALHLLKKLLYDPLPPASERARAIGTEARLPDGFDDWFAHCVARAPKDRFADIATARTELVRLLSDDLAVPAPRASRDALLANASLAMARTEADPARTPAKPENAPPAKPRPRGRLFVWTALACFAVGGGALLLRPVDDAPRPLAIAADAGAPADSPALSAREAHGERDPFGPTDPEDTVDHKVRWRIPLGDSPRRGGKEPLVTLVELADFECPFSARFEASLADAAKRYGADFAIVWKDVPLDIHPTAARAAHFARFVRTELPDDSRGFWPAHDALFESCSSLDVAHLDGIAHRLSVDQRRMRSALAQPAPDVDRDLDLAIDLGSTNIPTSYINGRRYGGALNVETLRLVIDAELEIARATVARGVPRAGLYDELTKGGVAGVPSSRVVLELEPSSGPTITSEHPIVDVDVFDLATDYFAPTVYANVKRLVAEHGKDLRVRWHILSEADDPKSIRVALAERAAFAIGGEEKFWRLYEKLLDNGDYYPACAKPRGFEPAQLLEYARDAGLHEAYFNQALEDPRARRALDETRETAKRAGFSRHDKSVFIGGYPAGMGGVYRQMERTFERARAEAH